MFIVGNLLIFFCLEENIIFSCYLKNLHKFLFFKFKLFNFKQYYFNILRDIFYLTLFLLFNKNFDFC